MTAQHHEARLIPPSVAPDPAALQHLDELMAEINRYDTQIRSLPDSSDPESDIRQLQAKRNELQKIYDDAAADIRRTGTIRTSEDLQKRDAELDAQRDQLVVAQNAPFTGPAPEAQGGESAVPDGVVESSATLAGIPRQNAAGVVHYPNPEPAVETK